MGQSNSRAWELEPKSTGQTQDSEPPGPHAQVGGLQEDLAEVHWRHWVLSPHLTLPEGRFWKVRRERSTLCQVLGNQNWVPVASEFAPVSLPCSYRFGGALNGRTKGFGAIRKEKTLKGEGPRSALREGRFPLSEAGLLSPCVGTPENSKVLSHDPAGL